MKSFSIIFCLSLSFGCSDQTRNIQSDVGRYQVVAGKFLQVSSEGEKTVETFIRIDTKNGRTWRFNPGVDMTVEEMDAAAKGNYLHTINDKWEPIKGVPYN